AALRPSHLGVTVADHAYDPAVAKGLVMSQRPAAGHRLREGDHVRVTVSLGPRPVNVPTNLAGQPLNTAKSVLVSLGLTVGAVTPASDMTIPEGSVIRSQPDSGTLLPGQAVALVVSTGKPKVPVPAIAGTPAGRSFAAAQAALQAVGLAATRHEVFNDTVPKGTVVTTSPASGQSISVGTP
ncbi:MAG: PASTA domain-containing protein, partial [Acidimicrobiaceae bacterium]|nr:PASTA domain-containing protein [Acidimicrobiaceae bacterium]